VKPLISVCIPAYQAESFIDRTLACARSQTHDHLQIIVSIDHGGDSTADVCNMHAREDARVTIIEQASRLGWSQNVNAALDAVQGEYFFIYFHDDVIEPNYVERLLLALEARPDAVTAHCDLLEFGLMDELRPAHAYKGSAAHRLAEFLVSPEKGTTLRSLTRSSLLNGGLRFPKIPGDNAWSAYPFHLIQLAAGPALAVHETLYRRWQRPGSLTRVKEWRPSDSSGMLKSMTLSGAICQDIINGAVEDTAQRRAVRYCLEIFMLLYARRQEHRFQASTLVQPEQIAPDFGREIDPADLATLGEDQIRMLSHMRSELCVLEAQLHHHLGDSVSWVASLQQALHHRPDNPTALDLQRQWLPAE
jgi:glycosyltransferase involved in cell wall biosynthesis